MDSHEALKTRSALMQLVDHQSYCINHSSNKTIDSLYNQPMTLILTVTLCIRDRVSIRGASPWREKRDMKKKTFLVCRDTYTDIAFRHYISDCRVCCGGWHNLGVDLLGGFSALVHKGITPGERTLIESLPEALAETTHVCSSINVGTTRAGINVDAVNLVAETMLKVSRATADIHGFGCAKMVVFANITEDNPFMAGTLLGAGEPDVVINAGVSGPGVVKCAIEKLLAADPDATLDEIAEEVKHTTYRVTRTGELIGRHVAKRLGVPFGVLDLSLAPTPKVGDSVGEIYQAMGIQKIGCPGTIAAVMMLNDAVKKGGAFASSSVGGLSGAFIPPMEDHTLELALTDGTLCLEKLEGMTSVCSVGLDMIMLPGDTSAATLAGIILDECAIGVSSRKTTGVRVIPVPGAKVGDYFDFGGLFGGGTVVAPRCPDGQEAFVRHGGHIPAPIHSLMN